MIDLTTGLAILPAVTAILVMVIIIKRVLRVSPKNGKSSSSSTFQMQSDHIGERVPGVSASCNGLAQANSSMDLTFAIVPGTPNYLGRDTFENSGSSTHCDDSNQAGGGSIAAEVAVSDPGSGADMGSGYNSACSAAE